MTSYFFHVGRSPNQDRYADTDQIGGAIQLYLREFMEDGNSSIMSYGETRDDIIFAVCKAVLIHEQLHAEIIKCCDTTGGQEHDGVFEWIANWLNDSRW